MKDSSDNNVSSNCVVRQDFTDVYDVCTEIGRGKFAIVKKCTHKTSGLEFAAKFLKKRRKGEDCRRNIFNEIRMLELSVNHPRIVSLIEVYETNLDLVIITDFAKGGELFQHINVEGQVDERSTVRLLRQILDGLAFLHNNNIAHLDVKPQNILLTEPLPDGDIKLCDFGLARDFNCGREILEIIGTPDYVAPEVLDYKPLNSTCDMWSVGVLTYVMLTGCSPFAGDTNQETFLNISQVNLDFPEDLFVKISTEATEFISKLLLKDQEERMTAQQSLDHRWLLVKEPSSTALVNALSAGSPSGQRRSATLTNDSISHEPVKKYKCDDSTSCSTAVVVTATKPKVPPKKDHLRKPVAVLRECSVTVVTECFVAVAMEGVTYAKNDCGGVTSAGTAAPPETALQKNVSQEATSQNTVSRPSVVNSSRCSASLARAKNFENANVELLPGGYTETIVCAPAKNRAKDSSGNWVKDGSGNWVKDSSGNWVKDSSGNWVKGNANRFPPLERPRDRRELACRISA